MPNVMWIFNLATEPPKIPQPILIVIEQKVEEPVEIPKEYTLEEKIKLNVNNCNEAIEWIRADDATCLAKPVARVSEVSEMTNDTLNTQTTVRRAENSSNGYSTGYCTWYVKNRRPDLPNGLGNANMWYSNARAFGLPTSTTPSAGAVGTTTRGSLGHVVYVESVNSDGTINISDMNYSGWNQISYRTVSASEFVYIN